jgi:hypothetical protein
LWVGAPMVLGGLVRLRREDGGVAAEAETEGAVPQQAGSRTSEDDRTGLDELMQAADDGAEDERDAGASRDDRATGSDAGDQDRAEPARGDRPDADFASVAPAAADDQHSGARAATPPGENPVPGRALPQRVGPRRVPSQRTAPRRGTPKQTERDRGRELPDQPRPGAEQAGRDRAEQAEKKRWWGRRDRIEPAAARGRGTAPADTSTDHGQLVPEQRGPRTVGELVAQREREAARRAAAEEAGGARPEDGPTGASRPRDTGSR